MTVTVGLVVPHATDVIPPEGPIMYPEAKFISHRTGVGSLTPEGFDGVLQKIVPAAENLAEQGADAIMVIGTSLTFYRGPQFNEDLQAEIRRKTGLPASTQSSAIIEGLRQVHAKTLAVATAYNDVINVKLTEFLSFHGFEVEALECFGITEFGPGDGVIPKTEDEIIELSSIASECAPSADGILISCGGLRTLNVAEPLERRFGRPVVSSTQAAFWSAMRLAGGSGKVSGYGRLLAG